MMKSRTMIKNVIVLVCFSAYSLSAQAVAWGSQTTITGYYVYDVGAAYIRVADLQNPDNCVSNHYLILDPGAANFKAIWAQVLTAHATGTTVTVRYSGCIGNYPKIDAVAVPGRW